MLQRNGSAVSLRDWADELLDGVTAVAEALDAGGGDTGYAGVVDVMRGLVADPESTPSGRILNELAETGASFFELAYDVSCRHRDYFGSITPLSATREAAFAEEAAKSLARQQEIEAADSESLDDYLRRYFS